VARRRGGPWISELAAGRSPDPRAPDLDGLVLDSLAAEGGDLDVWERLDEVLDASTFRPKLADHVEVKLFRLPWGDDYAIVANLRDLVHYRLEIADAELLRLMDGTRTVGEIVVERLQGAGDLDVDGVAAVVGLLYEGGFLDPQPLDTDALVAEAMRPTGGARRALRTFARTLRIEWSGADRLVSGLYRGGLRASFTPLGAGVLVALAIGGFAAFVAVESGGRFTLHAASAPTDSLILIALGLVLTFAHELGHAAVLTHYGRHIKNAGFLLYFGSPAFFVDATDGLMLDRWRRILQSAAGPLAELALAGIATIALWAFPDAGIAPLLYKFAVLNYFVIFLNLIPLLELDGYWILTDLIQVPDLRPRSLAFVQHDAWHKLRARERFTPQEIGLGLYAIVGIAFTILSVLTALFFWREVFGSLVEALWEGGVVGRLLLAALALFLGSPAIRGLIGLARAVGRRARVVVRAIRFRVETRWRVEAARLIDALPYVEDLPEELLSDLAGRVALRAVRRGQPVFRQGDRATAFYVVRSGRLQVEDEDPATGDRRVIRALGRGDSFGELGLLEAAPRAATVRAVDDAEVFEVDKGTFDRLLADEMRAPELGPTLQSLAELRAHPAFASLSPRDLSGLLDHGAWIAAGPGDEIVTEGEEGDAFYAIGSGQADVFEGEEHVRTLGPGSYFGEIALLSDALRTATVVARTPMRLYRLEREGFDAVVAAAFRRGALRTAVDRSWEH
jgi:CRP-like cAMP-binding protein